MALSKTRRLAWRRNLPHYQREGKPLFVSLATRRRWKLPEEARSIVLEHCLCEHGVRAYLYAVVVMPDHVHLLLTPLKDENRESSSLSEIMNGIKGASAHRINRALGRRGQVWEEEFFDHVLRRSETIDQKLQYIAENPVLEGLVTTPTDYPWLWINPDLK